MGWHLPFIEYKEGEAMKLNRKAEEACGSYLTAFDELIGDKRTHGTFRGIVSGIIAGESLRASVIARFSP
jgi:hypothetical protein